MTKDLLKNQHLTTEISNDCLIIRFTNPKERNPLSVSVLETLHFLLDGFAERQDIEKIIFTGCENIFASGANLREISKVTKETAREFALRGQTLMNKISEANQTTIAAVNGLCFGGALDLALSCDLRIASDEAVFCHPGANLGIITGWGGTQRLPRLIGQTKALEMFLTAKQVKAKEALEIGLIDKLAKNPLAESLAN